MLTDIINKHLNAEFTEFLRFLNEEEAQQISKEFEYICGIPNAIGTIDVLHIPILPPREGYRGFMNRKGHLAPFLDL
nr:unnamed protein product [Callosobruchus analis]